jgi:hypothetical protein
MLIGVLASRNQRLAGDDSHGNFKYALSGDETAGSGPKAKREFSGTERVYAAAIAVFACSARLAKAGASLTAKSARILRSSSTLAFFNPWTNWL